MPDNSTNRNDMFLNLMNNPTYRTVDFMDVGLNAENTILRPADEYWNDEKVRNNPLFETDGKPDKEKFNKVYNVSASMFNEIAQTGFDETVANEIEYQQGSVSAISKSDPTYTNPNEQVEVSEFGKDGISFNPDRHAYNGIEFGRITESRWTPKELAEMHKSYNAETGEWEDSPETWFGKNWFSNFWNPPVMAVYTKDDPEVQNGERREGEYKLDKNGSYYAERLASDIPVYNRETISFWDTLTKEDSWINRYDFFDSDDKDKSIAGSIFKTAATVVPMFIPGVNTYYIGASVGYQSAKLMTTLARMLGGGSDSSILNRSENWLNQFEMGVSEHSRENAWSFENMIGMAGDVFTQLKQQRWIFEQSPKLFGFKADITKEGVADNLLKRYEKSYVSELEKKYSRARTAFDRAGEMESLKRQIQFAAHSKAALDVELYNRNFYKAGSLLSKAYMTGITTLDSYNQAKAEGASDLQATFLALGYAAGEYALLNTAIGEMVLPELRLERKLLNKAIRMSAPLQEQAAREGTKRAKTTFARKMMELGKGLATGKWHGDGTLSAIAANGLGEGIEEMSEELLYDFTKQLYNSYYWLTGDDLRYKAWDNMGERYSLSFVGGLMGGSLFSGTQTYNAFKNGLYANMDNRSANEYLISLIRQGKRQDIENAIDKMTFSNPYLSSNEFLGSGVDAGFAASIDSESQDAAAKRVFRNVLDFYESTLDGAGINLPDNSVIDKNMLGYQRYNQLLAHSTSAANYIQDFNTASERYTNSVINYRRAYNMYYTGNPDKAPVDSAKPINADNPDVTAALDAAKNEMLEAKENAQSYINGDRADEFVLMGMFETNPYLHESFSNMDFSSWIEGKYGDAAKTLSEEQIMAERRIYNDEYAASGRDRLRDNFNIFMRAFSVINPALNKSMERYLENRESNPKIEKLLQQARFDNSMLNAAIKSMANDNTSLFDFLLQEAASDKRIISDDAGVHGTDMNFTSFTNETNPGEAMTNYINEQMKTLPSDLTNEQKEQQRLKFANEWYSKFAIDYRNSAIELIEELSRQEYITQEERRVANELYSTYTSMSENRMYDKNIMNENKDKALEKLSYIMDIDTSESYITDEDISLISEINSILISPKSNESISREDAKKISDLMNQFNASINSKIDDINTSYDSEYLPVISELSKDLQSVINTGVRYTPVKDADIDIRMKDAMDNINSKPYTPVLDVLNEFYNESGKTAFEIIENVENAFKTASTSPSGFTLSKGQVDEIGTLSNQIKMIRSVINGSRSDNGSLTNPEGFANMANKMFGEGTANVIDGTYAKRIMADLDMISARLDNILSIAAINSTRSLEEHKKMFVNRSAIIYNGIKTLKDTGIDVPLSNTEIALSNPDMGIIERFSSSDEKTISLSEDSYGKLMSAITKLERAIYEDFKDHRNDVDLFRKIMDSMNFLVEKTEPVNTGTKAFDPQSFTWYLTSIIASDPASINNVMKKLYDGKDIAPVPMQEIAVKMMVSYLTGHDTFSAMKQAYSQSLLGKVDKMLEDEKYDELIKDARNVKVNIKEYIDSYKNAKNEEDKNNAKGIIRMIIANSDANVIFDAFMAPGSTGCGKTSSLIRSIVRALTLDDNGNELIENSLSLLENVYVVSTNENIHFEEDGSPDISKELVNVVKDVVGTNGTVTTLSHSELLEDMFGNDYDNAIHSNLVADVSDGSDAIIHTTVDTIKTRSSKWPSLIILDENSKLDQLEIDAITRIANENGVKVLMFGDEDQISNYTTVNKKDVSCTMNGHVVDTKNLFQNGTTFQMLENHFIHSPKIGISMRPNNSQKSANSDLLRKAVFELSFNRKANVEMSYHIDESNLYGDMVRTEFDDSLMDVITGMIATRGSEKIGLISSKNGKILDKLINNGLIKVENDGRYTSDIFKIYNSAEDVQGRELKYYIYELGHLDKLPERAINKYKSLYVAATRSKQGSLIIGNFNDSNFTMTSKEDSNTIMSQITGIPEYTNRYVSMISAYKEPDEIERLSIERPHYSSVMASESDGGTNNNAGGNNNAAAAGTGSMRTNNGTNGGNSVVNKPIPNIDGTDPDMNNENVFTGPVINGYVDSGKSDIVRRKIDSANETTENDIGRDVVILNNEPLGSASMISRAYTFNVVEIGNGVHLTDNGRERILSYSSNYADSLNGIMRIVELVLSDEPDFNRVFSQSGDTRYINLDRLISNMNKGTGLQSSRDIDVKKTLDTIIIRLHNSIISSGFNEDTIFDSVIDSIKYMFDDFSNINESKVRELVGKIKSKFSITNFSNGSTSVLYGLKKMIDRNTANKVHAERGITIPGNLISDDTMLVEGTSNDSSIRTKFSVFVNYDNGDKIPTTLIEIPLFGMNNLNTFMKNDGFSIERNEDGSIRSIDGNEEDANIVAKTMNYSNAMDTIMNFDSGVNKGIKNKMRSILMSMSMDSRLSNEMRAKSKFLSVMIGVDAMTMPGIVFFDNETFRNMMDEATSIGPSVYTKDIGLDYLFTDGYTFTAEDTPLEQFAENPKFVSSVMMSSKTTYEKYGIQAGVPFIIISNDPNTTSERKDLLEIYKDEVDSGKNIMTTKIIYPTPPSVSFETYMNKLFNIVKTKGVNNFDKIIGNPFTAYNILKRVFSTNGKADNVKIDNKNVLNVLNHIGVSNLNMSDEFGRNISLSEFITETMNNLINAKDGKELKNMLINNKINSRLNMILLFMTADYGSNSKFTNLNIDNISKISDILKSTGMNGVFMFPKMSDTKISGIDDVYELKMNLDNPDENDIYSIILDGSSYPFTIHGKIEMPTLMIPYGRIIDEIDKLNPVDDNKELRASLSRYYSISKWADIKTKKPDSKDDDIRVEIKPVIRNSEELSSDEIEHINTTANELNNSTADIPVVGFKRGEDGILFAVTNDIKNWVVFPEPINVDISTIADIMVKIASQDEDFEEEISDGKKSMKILYDGKSGEISINVLKTDTSNISVNDISDFVDALISPSGFANELFESLADEAPDISRDLFDLKTMIESSANKSDIINKFVSIMNNDYNGTTGGNFIFSIMSVSNGNDDVNSWDSVGFKFVDDLINNKLCKF